jgi:RNA polymerase-binding transcription factor DksA
MSKSELNKYREQLMALGQRLQRDFRDVASEALRGTGGEPSGNLSNAPVHLADLSNDTFEQEVSLGLLENQGQILEQIAAALERIDRGTYGQCDECRKAIPAERLKAVPYTPHCVACAARVQGER